MPRKICLTLCFLALVKSTFLFDVTKVTCTKFMFSSHENLHLKDVFPFKTPTCLRTPDSRRLRILEGCRGYTPQYVVAYQYYHPWAGHPKKTTPTMEWMMLIWWIVKDMKTCTLGGVHLSGAHSIFHRVFLAQHFAATKKRPTRFCIFLGETGTPMLLRLRKWNGKMKMAWWKLDLSREPRIHHRGRWKQPRTFWLSFFLVRTWIDGFVRRVYIYMYTYTYLYIYGLVFRVPTPPMVWVPR